MYKVVQTVCIDYGIYDSIVLGTFDTLEQAQAFAEDKYNTSGYDTEYIYKIDEEYDVILEGIRR